LRDSPHARRIPRVLRRPDPRGDDHGHRASEGGSGGDPGGAPTRALAPVCARAPTVDCRTAAAAAPRSVRTALEHLPRTRTTSGRALHEDYSNTRPCRRLTTGTHHRAACSLNLLTMAAHI